MLAFLLLIQTQVFVASADAVVLPIAPVAQQRPSWCWLAMGEMVLRYTGVLPASEPLAQCNLAQTMAQQRTDEASLRCSADCRACDGPANDLATVIAVLVDGPRRTSWRLGQSVPRLFASPAGVLSHDDIGRELAAGRPIVLGINPTWTPALTQAQHLVLLIGQDGNRVLINDPYDYGKDNPYIKVGASSPQPRQHWIERSSLLEKLGWVESILVRKDGHHTPPMTRCLMPSGTCLAPVALKPGSACRCRNMPGVVVRSGP
jgi:Peptidase_C39 like family